jgi:hypothetical protein
MPLQRRDVELKQSAKRVMLDWACQGASVRREEDIFVIPTIEKI